MTVGFGSDQVDQLHSRRRRVGLRSCGAVQPRTLLVASDVPFARTDFEAAVANSEGFALAGTCAWRDVVDRTLRWHPDVVVLDASVPRVAGVADTVGRLRALDHSPMITLLVQDCAAKADIDRVDAVVAMDRGVAAVLTVLEVLASGAVVAMAPRASRVHTGVSRDYEVRQRLSTLTKREREILRLVVDGLSNREVGSRLFISPETVKEYVSRILAKLKVTSRIEAAVAAVRAEFDDGEW
ncbi:RNA polymerase sigma factor (sigma-70 family) [Nocardia tenerifensis]|uniref:RNA polymerase sigma factor (Sigma-70 family) n=1 Tax=Nocardia tenerifensis TaxID=228006 RepID=A0A318KEM2_9NOCA|nr:response regulator transcription factor [Nocardia tenerifensis]PXX71259.1 RNA polymerase sigma factor (sigma-70 family) [Nocardia tenerifensis]